MVKWKRRGVHHLPDAGRLDRDINLLPLAALIAMEQGEERSSGGFDAGFGRSHGNTQAHWRAVRVAEQILEAATSLQGEIRPLPIASGSFLSEWGDGGENQIRFDG